MADNDTNNNRSNHTVTATGGRDVVERLVTLLGSSASQTSSTEASDPAALADCFSSSSFRATVPSTDDPKNDLQPPPNDGDSNGHDAGEFDHAPVLFLPSLHVDGNDARRLQVLIDEVQRDDNDSLALSAASCGSNSTASRTLVLWATLSSSVRDAAARFLTTQGNDQCDGTTTTTAATTIDDLSTLAFTRTTAVTAPLLLLRNVQEAFQTYAKLRFLEWRQLLRRQQQSNPEAVRLAELLTFSKMIVSCRGNTTLQVIVGDDDDQKAMATADATELACPSMEPHDGSIKKDAEGERDDDTVRTVAVRIQVELFVKIRRGVRSFATSNFTLLVSTIGNLHYSVDPTDGGLSYVALSCNRIQQDILHPIQSKANMIVLKAVACQASESMRWTMGSLERLWEERNGTENHHSIIINNNNNRKNKHVQREFDSSSMDDTVSIHTQSTVSSSSTDDSNGNNVNNEKQCNEVTLPPDVPRASRRRFGSQAPIMTRRRIERGDIVTAWQEETAIQFDGQYSLHAHCSTSEEQRGSNRQNTSSKPTTERSLWFQLLSFSVLFLVSFLSFKVHFFFHSLSFYHHDQPLLHWLSALPRTGRQMQPWPPVSGVLVSRGDDLSLSPNITVKRNNNNQGVPLVVASRDNQVGSLVVASQEGRYHATEEHGANRRRIRDDAHSFF